MKFYPDEPEKIDSLEHFSLKKDFSFNLRKLYLIGGRRYGKTFSVKKFILKHAIKEQSEFFWSRSTDVALANLTDYGFFSRVEQFLPEWGIQKHSIKNNKVYLNGRLCGMLLSVSTFHNAKGADFTVDFGVWDEFMRAKGERPVPDKLEKFNDLCESVLRGNGRKIFYNTNSTNCYDEVLQPFKTTFKEGYGCYVYREMDSVVHYIRSSAAHLRNMEASLSGVNMSEEEKDMAFYNKFSDHGDYGKQSKTKYLFTVQISDRKFISVYRGGNAYYIKDALPEKATIFTLENHYVNNIVHKMTQAVKRSLQDIYNRGNMVFLDGYSRSAFIDNIM